MKKEIETSNMVKRSQRIIIKDRGKPIQVHNGMKWITRNRQEESAVGLKWGDRLKTRKPCTKGANKIAGKRR